ncbi:hypothetical protein C1U49_03345 [Campylobacter jejuni]|nr:hypothetical protein [Campylobacter jejuni]HEG6768375.1 hypothetical protein [Campylobacter jejuni]
MDFNSVLFSIGDKLPKDATSTVTLKEKFDRLNEDKQKEVVAQLPMIKLKSPALVFWVGTFLFGAFGVGRFMIGDWVLGLIRLGITIVAMFLVGKKLRKQNFEKIANIIQ